MTFDSTRSDTANRTNAAEMYRRLVTGSYPNGAIITATFN